MPNNTQTDVDAIIAAHMAANPDAVMVTSGNGGTGEPLPSGMVAGLSIPMLATMRGTFGPKDVLAYNLRLSSGGRRQTSISGQAAFDTWDVIDRASKKLYRFGRGQLREHLGIAVTPPVYRGPAGTPSGAIRKGENVRVGTGDPRK